MVPTGKYFIDIGSMDALIFVYWYLTLYVFFFIRIGYISHRLFFIMLLGLIVSFTLLLTLVFTYFLYWRRLWQEGSFLFCAMAGFLCSAGLAALFSSLVLLGCTPYALPWLVAIGMGATAYAFLYLYFEGPHTDWWWSALYTSFFLALYIELQQQTRPRLQERRVRGRGHLVSLFFFLLLHLSIIYTHLPQFSILLVHILWAGGHAGNIYLLLCSCALCFLSPARAWAPTQPSGFFLSYRLRFVRRFWGNYVLFDIWERTFFIFESLDMRFLYELHVGVISLEHTQPGWLAPSQASGACLLHFYVYLLLDTFNLALLYERFDDAFFLELDTSALRLDYFYD
jgi:hypothetical protein